MSKTVVVVRDKLFDQSDRLSVIHPNAFALPVQPISTTSYHKPQKLNPLPLKLAGVKKLTFNLSLQPNNSSLYKNAKLGIWDYSLLKVTKEGLRNNH
ncbi:hypothetical protein [Nostoc sp. DedQUE09]|uniref:hypothetical protein n=1 Tax=Nostoc sp. DedQUE09 TaxID=3075394 RepID=UPI002AD592B4|nr:hypothetical protein [Nostoc sp. DedQUE09]MDZ7950699.1 hypothetical protein [Nostoc sp. DedQUE09]